jgi:hypothetical protein
MSGKERGCLPNGYRCRILAISTPMNSTPASGSDSLSPATLKNQFTQFANADIGSPLLAGSACQVDTGWDVSAAGADIWEKRDQFHFVYRPVEGDFDIAVRVDGFTPAHLYSKAGLMIRETLGPDSPHLMFLVFSDNSHRNNNLGAYEMQFRPAVGADCQGVYPAVKPPAPPEFPAAFPNSWLRVVRRGDCFSAFGSTDGMNWRIYGKQELSLSPTVYAGPALTSHEPGVLARAAFRDYRQSR